MSACKHCGSNEALLGGKMQSSCANVEGRMNFRLVFALIRSRLVLFTRTICSFALLHVDVVADAAYVALRLL